MEQELQSSKNPRMIFETCVIRKPNNINASWESFSRKPVWSVISSRELSKVFGVSLQTINNWRMRNILPAPELPSRHLHSGRNWYKISKIRSWLEERPEEAIEWEWIELHMNTGTPYSSLEQAYRVAYVAYDAFDIEKPLTAGAL